MDAYVAQARFFPCHVPCPLDVGVRLTQVLEWSFWRWKRLHEERNEKGRLKSHVREKRPPLPELPRWIE